MREFKPFGRNSWACTQEFMNAKLRIWHKLKNRVPFALRESILQMHESLKLNRTQLSQLRTETTAYLKKSKCRI